MKKGAYTAQPELSVIGGVVLVAIVVVGLVAGVALVVKILTRIL